MPNNFIEARLAICNGCEFNVQGDCALCGCVIADKVQKPEESCPAIPPRWGSLTGLPDNSPNRVACVPCQKNR